MGREGWGAIVTYRIPGIGAIVNIRPRVTTWCYDLEKWSGGEVEVH
jgi:hypothetical protein